MRNCLVALVASFVLFAPATASASEPPPLKKWQKPLMEQYMKAKKSGDEARKKRAVERMVRAGLRREGIVVGKAQMGLPIPGTRPIAKVAHHCGYNGLYCYEVYQIALLNANYKCQNIYNWYGGPCINPGYIEWAGWLPGWVGVIMSTGQHWINDFYSWKRHCREAVYTIHGSNGSWANQANPNGPETCWRA